MKETNTTSGPVMNSPAATLRQETGITPLHSQRTQTPCADVLTGASSEPEARPVTPTAQSKKKRRMSCEQALNMLGPRH